MTGPPIGSANGYKHGARSQAPFRLALRLPLLGKGVKGVRQSVDLLRRHLEDAITKQHGEVPALYAAWINAACTYEMARLCAHRRLKTEPTEITTLEAVTAFTKLRQAAIDRLHLPEPVASGKGDPWHEQGQAV